MRHSWTICVAALIILASQPEQVAAQAPAPYSVVPVAPAKPVSDPTLDAFRKELGDIAKRKDRAALSRLIVYRGFFWEGDDKSADPRKSGIDNLAAALGLDAKDGSGWDALAELAAEANAGPDAD